MLINPALAAEARKVLDMNKSERHIRGGLATREKKDVISPAQYGAFLQKRGIKS